MRKAGLPSAALGAAFTPLLTVCSAVLARGTPATLSAMVELLYQDKSCTIINHMPLSAREFPQRLRLLSALGAHPHQKQGHSVYIGFLETCQSEPAHTIWTLRQSRCLDSETCEICCIVMFKKLSR